VFNSRDFSQALISPLQTLIFFLIITSSFSLEFFSFFSSDNLDFRFSRNKLDFFTYFPSKKEKTFCPSPNFLFEQKTSSTLLGKYSKPESISVFLILSLFKL